jgi:5-methylcytosine-specific restriction protein A
VEPVLYFTGDSFNVLEPDCCPPVMAAPATPQESRSPHWPAVQRAAVVAHPFCACCGGKMDLQVHHVQPFHVHAELELEPSNLIVLCRRDHFFVGHLGDWKSWNSAVREDAAAWLKKIEHRPY